MGELPPIQQKRKNNDEENEIIGLIKKNSLFDKAKIKTQLAQSVSTKKDLTSGPVKVKNPYEDLPAKPKADKKDDKKANPLR